MINNCVLLSQSQCANMIIIYYIDTFMMKYCVTLLAFCYVARLIYSTLHTLSTIIQKHCATWHAFNYFYLRGPRLLPVPNLTSNSSLSLIFIFLKCRLYLNTTLFKSFCQSVSYYKYACWLLVESNLNLALRVKICPYRGADVASWFHTPWSQITVWKVQIYRLHYLHFHLIKLDSTVISTSICNLYDLACACNVCCVVMWIYVGRRLRIN